VGWIIDFDKAYRAWVAAKKPTDVAELQMMLWLIGLEQSGPPPLIGHSAEGYDLAVGPHGERVEFAVTATPLGLPQPPWGIIGVRSIT
jgi:hypothetical protein